MSAAPPKILVAAIGNPDRGDDGIGILVASRLSGRLPPDVALTIRSGDILSIIEDWAGFYAVICIDAAATIGVPGRIHRIDAAAGGLPVDLSFPSCHAFGLAEAIALGRALHSLPETVIVYAIEGNCFEGGATVTPAVSLAAGQVVEAIVAEVNRLRSEERGDLAHNTGNGVSLDVDGVAPRRLFSQDPVREGPHRRQREL
jgi:hydrogenase maturation protease